MSSAQLQLGEATLVAERQAREDAETRAKRVAEKAMQLATALNAQREGRRQEVDVYKAECNRYRETLESIEGRLTTLPDNVIASCLALARAALYPDQEGGKDE